MGAPGLAFETWDPPRKCRQTNLESSDFETVLFGVLVLALPDRPLGDEKVTMEVR